MKIPGEAELRFVISIASFSFTEQQFVKCQCQKGNKNTLTRVFNGQVLSFLHLVTANCISSTLALRTLLFCLFMDIILAKSDQTESFVDKMIGFFYCIANHVHISYLM